MGRTYEQVYTGKWLPYVRRNQRIRCCDCCLVHVYNFRIRKGQLEIQIFRDNRATAASRRAAGLTIRTKKPKKK